MGGSVKKVFKKAASVATLGLSDSLSGTPGSPELPAMITPTGAPTEDAARMASEQSDLLRRRRGRAATILTGQRGDQSTANVGTKTLLGN